MTYQAHTTPEPLASQPYESQLLRRLVEYAESVKARQDMEACDE